MLPPATLPVRAVALIACCAALCMAAGAGAQTPAASAATTASAASAQPATGKTATRKQGQRTKRTTTTTASPSKSQADLGTSYATRPEVMQIANEIAERQHLDVDWVRQAIGQARQIPAIAKAVLPPAVGVAKNWTLYRSRFIEPTRIRAGVKFWRANAQTLQRAEEQTGVPAAIIVGIIGIETMYGQHTGNFRVMDALCTLAFDFPPQHPKASARSAFFRSELEAFLSLTAHSQTDPLALRGSYAGAMGLPQFMPSSWVQYGVDFDGDGHIDLFNNASDVIGSVANYFKAFHWQSGMPTHYAVTFDADKLDKPALLAPDILPTFSAAQMAQKGVQVEAAGAQHQGLLALVELQNGAAPPQYVAGTENFYALTRYNWSSYYAMAVIELAHDIEAAMPK